MTRLEKQIDRMTNTILDGSFGPDHDRKLAIRLLPGHGANPDAVLVWPAGTRRKERVNLDDLYRFAIRCRVNRMLLEKARSKKEAKAHRLARARQQRAEERLIYRGPRE